MEESKSKKTFATVGDKSLKNLETIEINEDQALRTKKTLELESKKIEVI